MVKTLIDLHLGHFFSCLIKPANLVMVAKWQVHLAQRQMNSPIIQIKKSRYKLTGIALDESM